MRPRSTDPFLFARRASARGFTLIELAVVVIIISVFAALAIPQVTRQLRDRRVQEAAQRVLQTYQQARERAVGRGGAVLVRYERGAGDQGRFRMFEGRMGAADANERCPFLPNPSCAAVNWTDTAPNGAALQLMSWDLSTDYGFEGVFVDMFEGSHTVASSTSTQFAEICFTPLGRTFVRYTTANNTQFQPLTDVPMAEVFRSVGTISSQRVGLTRRVILLPTGGGRIESELVNAGTEP